MRTQEVSAISLQRRIEGMPPLRALRLLAEVFPRKCVFSTSFGMEDQAVTDMIAAEGIPIRIFTLDTGRLFPETHATWSATVERYRVPIEVYVPDAAALGGFMASNGPNAFYESVALRKECCRIRKVEPLRRALAGNRLWVTGIRSGQSAHRGGLPSIEWDEAFGLFKYHPLLHWSLEELRGYLRERGVPLNPLHDRGFPSIGCAPCTRAVREGEDIRSGRWWWEDNDKRECGLHAR